MTVIIVMSEIMKARDRILNRKNNIHQIQQPLHQSNLTSINVQSHSQPISKKFKLNSVVQPYQQQSIQRSSSTQLNTQIERSPPYNMLKKADKMNGSFNRDAKSQYIDGSKFKDDKRRRTSARKIQSPNNQSLDHNNISQLEINPYHRPPLMSKQLIIAKPYRIVCISPYKPSQCSKEHAEKLISKKGSAFVDELFPPKISILYPKKALCTEQAVKFERLGKIYPNSTIVQYCQPSQIVAGKLSSISLYSALIILCQFPQKIANIFGNQSVNNEGVYYLLVCKDGVWRYVIIDDYVPLKMIFKKQYLGMSNGHRNEVYELWPMLIEKVVAKIYGSYYNLYLTKGVKALIRLLMGLPVSEYEISKDFRTYLIIIDTALKNNQIVVIEGLNQQSIEVLGCKSLVVGYSYRILQVHKNYILIRNIQDYQYTTKLSFEQCTIFSRLLLFRNEKDYTYTSIKLRHKIGFYSRVKIQINQNMRCYFDIWENNREYYRNYDINENIYQNSLYFIVIKDQNNQIIEKINVLGKYVQFKIGFYFIEIHLCLIKESDFTLSIYSSSNPILQRIKNYQQWYETCNCNT